MATNINWFVLWLPSSQAMIREKKKPTDIEHSRAGENGDGGKTENHHTKFEAR